MLNQPKSGSLLSSFVAVAVFALALSGCQNDEPEVEKGPAEKLGQQIDQAASRAASELNKAAEKAGQGLQKAGESLQKAAREAQSRNEQKQK